MLSAFVSKKPDAGAEPERVKREIEEVVGIDCSNAIMVSAKQVTSSGMQDIMKNSPWMTLYPHTFCKILL